MLLINIYQVSRVIARPCRLKSELNTISLINNDRSKYGQVSHRQKKVNDSAWIKKQKDSSDMQVNVTLFLFRPDKFH